MIKRLFLCAIALVVFFPALARAQSTMTIGVVGSSSVANTAAYGTIVDALVASNSSGSRVHGVTWSISGNSNFYVDFFGDVHTGWNSIIAPGPQTMTITASAAGYTTASLPLTVTVTGTLALQTMLVTSSQVATAFDNSPSGTIIYSLTVSQTNGTLGNLNSGVTWTVDKPPLLRRHDDGRPGHLLPHHDMERPNRRWPSDGKSHRFGSGVYHRGFDLDDCRGRFRQSGDDDRRQRVQFGGRQCRSGERGRYA